MGRGDYCRAQGVFEFGGGDVCVLCYFLCCALDPETTVCAGFLEGEILQENELGMKCLWIWQELVYLELPITLRNNFIGSQIARC